MMELKGNFPSINYLGAVEEGEKIGKINMQEKLH